MARRIVLVLLALIGALLVTSMVPLGLITTGHARDSFREDTVLAAQTLASVAEESLADHTRPAALAQSLARARGSGEHVWVYDKAGHLLAATGGRRAPVQPGVLAPVLAGAPGVVVEADDRLQVVVGVRDALQRAPVGALVLSRSAAELDERVAVLWAWLAGVTGAGLLAAAVLAVALARWVSRPLSALDGAAQQLGQGVLDTRSEAGHGPPEVRRLAANFNTMAARLETLVHGHRATMADVSHQLRTPLAALRLRLDVLAQDTDPATVAELAGAQDEVARLSRLVDGLLAVARAENVVIEPVPVAVGAVISDRAAAWRPVAEERGVILETDCAGRVSASLGEGHLEQILDNLLANALDAVPAGGHVTVSARETGPGARVQVADDGPGMSDQQRDAAFRRFATSHHGGAGLGLAIVHRLVTSNGGSAELSKTPGGGLTVTFDLRRSQERVPRTGAGTPARSPISLPFLNPS
jgi:signal transduction histidine kinase